MDSFNDMDMIEVMACETLVPFYDMPVSCGLPTGTGDILCMARTIWVIMTQARLCSGSSHKTPRYSHQIAKNPHDKWQKT